MEWTGADGMSGAGNGFECGVIILEADSAVNLIQEFIQVTRPPSIQRWKLIRR